MIGRSSGARGAPQGRSSGGRRALAGALTVGLAAAGVSGYRNRGKFKMPRPGMGRPTL